MKIYQERASSITLTKPCRAFHSNQNECRIAKAPAKQTTSGQPRLLARKAFCDTLYPNLAGQYVIQLETDDLAVPLLFTVDVESTRFVRLSQNEAKLDAEIESNYLRCE